MKENMAEELQTLSLSELRETLEARGVSLSLSALSELIRTGDIGELLHIGGKGNRKEFPPDAVDVLAAFWPRYKEANGRLPQAPAMLRGFLKQENSGLIALVPAASEFSETLKLADGAALDRHTQALVRHAEALEALPAPDDRLLTLKEAHALYGVSLAALHTISFREGGRRKVKASAVRAYIASL
jgi:hypothetical protein